jgi:hypothetical protein
MLPAGKPSLGNRPSAAVVDRPSPIREIGVIRASILAKALGQRKYSSIVAGGWPGSVVQADSSKFGNLFFIEPDAVSKTNPLYVAQLDHIQWFDCKGTNTAQS